MSKELPYQSVEARHPSVSYLVCVRHGESTYNQQGLWTGWIDVPLTDKGIEDARMAGSMIGDIEFDHGFVSSLMRAKQTFEHIQQAGGLEGLTFSETDALRERHYGDFAGRNKWEVKASVGDEEFQRIRRGFDTPIPNGESSREVTERVMSYYELDILPRLMAGENLLIVAHGNSIRALAMGLEPLTEDEFAGHEVGIGEVHVYLIDRASGQALAKMVRAEKANKGQV